MELYTIDCGNMMVDGGALFGVIPKTMWQKRYKCNEDNLCNIAIRSLLVVDGDRKILIDTGCGNKQDDTFFKYHYLNGDGDLVKSLDKNGFKPEDITDIIHTHLHFDHCGGTLQYDENRDIVPTFPNANIWVSESQWKWAINPNRREAPAFPKENIQPMVHTQKLHLVQAESELFPNIYVLFANGHTRGQMIPIIDYNGKKIVYVADLIPTMANVPLSFISAYDLFQLDVIEEKQKILDVAVENDMVLFFEHDIDTECCTLQKTPKGVQVKESFDLNVIL
jgi:glyoxylase-like metal-dependent hydrolase (beta-lactamase superfamily II)